MTVMMVYQINPRGIKLYFWANNLFFFSNPNMAAGHVSENAPYKKMRKMQRQDVGSSPVTSISYAARGDAL